MHMCMEFLNEGQKNRLMNQIVVFFALLNSDCRKWDLNFVKSYAWHLEEDSSSQGMDFVEAEAGA